MTDQGIKSRPKYEPLNLKPQGKRHLIITETMDVEDKAFASGVGFKDFDEHWAILGHSKAIPKVEYDGETQEFRSLQHILTALNGRLLREKMGFCLYAVGSLPFLGAINNAAAQFCLSREEIGLFEAGPKARRVFCVHCHTITEGVTTNVFECSACGANLFVRDHYSKRLSAFAGVQVDAEAPGEIPPIEEIYS